VRIPTSALIAAATLFGSALIVCQEKPPASRPAPRPADAGKELEKKLEEFTKLVKGRKDKQAIAVVDGLLRRLDELPAKARTKLARTVGSVLTKQRPSRSAKNKELFERCAVALGKMGKPGSTPLREAYDYKKFKGAQWMELRALMLRQVGKTGDLGKTGFLVKTARHVEQNLLKAAAGEALGEFEKAPLRLRKGLFDDVKAELVRVYDLSRTGEFGELQRATFEKRFAAIRAPWNATLQKLSGRRYTDPHAWRDFWNKHKRANWDKLRGSRAER